jgi:AcrR family transcriptional regulator
MPMDEHMEAGLDLLRDAPAKERKRGLSRERVVEAAVAVADEDGLDAVSMARVAERLGFTTMSLYRHVRSKDELTLLMTNEAIGEPPEHPDGGDWRARLEQWSWDLVEGVRRHPWLLDVPLSRPPWTRGQLVWLDRALAALAGTGLTESEKAASILLLNGHVFSQARFVADLGEPQDLAGYVDGLKRLLDDERFPALRRAVHAGIFDPDGDDTDDDFRFGLERVLDGIEHLVELRAN